jgi:hypothetical protein
MFKVPVPKLFRYLAFSWGKAPLELQTAKHDNFGRDKRQERGEKGGESEVGMRGERNRKITFKENELLLVTITPSALLLTRS